eukprot:COSAG04_NODE_17106_length_479_cov_0.810526_2_plen_90_part_01
MQAGPHFQGWACRRVPTIVSHKGAPRTLYNRVKPLMKQTKADVPLFDSLNGIGGTSVSRADVARRASKPAPPGVPAPAHAWSKMVPRCLP